MAGFLVVAFFGLLTAGVSLFALETAKTLLGVLPLLGYLATIARAFQVGIRDATQRNVCMILGCGVVIGSGFCLIALDGIISSEPSHIFALNGVILFCLLMGLQLGTERFGFYSRLTTNQRRWLNCAWSLGILLSLLLYCIYRLQGNLDVAHFLSNIWWD